MKRKVLVIALIGLICAFAVFADAYKDVNSLIARGLSEENLKKIAELSPQLTQEQKESIFRWKKVPTFLPACMNIFLGFGSGSFDQGDDGMGIAFLVGDVLCAGIVAYDIVTVGWENFINSLTGKGGGPQELSLAKIALIAAGGLRIWQGIRPFTYASSKNAKLKTALGLNDVAVGLAPVLTEDGPGFALSAKFSF